MTDPINDTITAVPGVLVGHTTNTEAMTGVTVITLPRPNMGVSDVRGGGPGTRETELLGAAIKPVAVDAIVFSGGSAFGLAAADGVMTEVENDGGGVPTPGGNVPIVPSAIIFDLMVGRPDVRPTPLDGAAAYRARTADPVAQGSVGAGTGALVNKWGGWDNVQKGGLGSAALTGDGYTVGALAVVNAVGRLATRTISEEVADDPPSPQMAPAPVQNTTLVAVVTNVGISSPNELRRLAIRAHDALGATLIPAHTRYDGDTVFVIDTGSPNPAADIDTVAELAFTAVARSIIRGVEQA